MKKKLLVLIMIFTMISGTMLNYRQPVKHVVQDDDEIEWNSCIGEELL
ncbi:hypothetical protein [Anaerosalibacter sp. Marseille-P3206]|nr:hypothetical protein [Anaerosalibacter sp. Marseille-P3206]